MGRNKTKITYKELSQKFFVGSLFLSGLSLCACSHSSVKPNSDQVPLAPQISMSLPIQEDLPEVSVTKVLGSEKIQVAPETYEVAKAGTRAIKSKKAHTTQNSQIDNDQAGQNALDSKPIEKSQEKQRKENAKAKSQENIHKDVAKVATVKPRTNEAPLIFDIPVAYNSQVKFWVAYFQTSGRPWYTKWLERSSRYLPALQKTLKANGLPQDLAYIAMIESGFSSQASSAAKAVGPWQFIRQTGERYGLRVTWWLDERRDFQKSTDAAAKYLKKLYGMFHNWYLVAASYNTGENRIKRLVERHGSNNFWKLAQSKLLQDETRNYVPKLIAALLIAKSPQMYGFHNIKYSIPLTFEHFQVPGGTRLDVLADAIGVAPEAMRELNPELVRGYVPITVSGHMIRIPSGSMQLVSHYFKRTFVSER